jgi:very-short-patch-repair endonuclease
MEDPFKKYRSPQQWQFWIIRERINPDTGKIYTEEEAKIHVSSFRKWSKYYWIKRGYTDEEAIEQVFNIQSRLSKNSAEKHKDNKEKLPNQVGYWTKRGYSEEESIKLVTQRQTTFNLDICIEKYGDELGRIKHKERQDKWQDTLKSKEDQTYHSRKSLSLEEFIKKGLTLDDYVKHRIDVQKSDAYISKKTAKFLIDNDMELTSKTFNKYYNRFMSKIKYFRGEASKESLTYLLPIYKFCRRTLKLERNDLILGVGGSKEFFVQKPLKNRKGWYKFDFTILSKKIIIEYNGFYFHPDPSNMDENKFDTFKVPCSRIDGATKYENDKKKLKFIENLGYQVIVIWSHLDYNEQMNSIKEQLINACKN